ncbi:MAG: PKD domain-containing protein, partial [Nitrososphaerota archaeon]|nr:PKD domain-containing protein [Nitrososphaerota archaeon]
SCIDGPPAWPAGCVSGLGGHNLSNPNFQPFTQAGTYPVSVNISDSTGWDSTLRFNESVYWPINVSIPVIPLVHQGTQANVTFTLFQNHGAPPMEWWLNDSTRGMTLCGPVAVPSYGIQSCSFVPNWNGTDTLNLTVRDGLHSRLFVPFSYQVVSDLGSLTLSAQAGSYSAVQGGTLQDEVGATTTFIASYVGGSSPYTCTLIENGSGTIALWSSSTTSCSTTYTWTHMGTYTLNLTVKDSLGGAGGSARQWLLVDVTAPVSVKSITSAQTNLDAQVIDNISAKTTGGLTPYNFVWDFGNGATKTTIRPWVTYAWPSPGSFTVKITVTDGTGASSTLSTSVQVIADPAVKVMSMVDGPISTSGITSGGSTTLPSGTTASFNLTFAGGTGSYSVVWKLNGTTVNSTAVFNLWTNLSLSWPSVGNHSLSVTISDSEGQVSTFTLSVKVIVDMVGPVTLTISRSVVDSGMRDNATASATGGWAPFTYDWLISAASGNRWINGSVNALEGTWTASGSYSITATVIDAFGYRASEVTKLTVNTVPLAPCAPQLVTGIPMAGNTLTFSLSCVSGGTGPLSYSWNLGADHQVTSVPRVTVTFHQATSYEVSVNVTDALGETAESKVLTLGTIPPSIDNVTYQKLSLSHNTTSNGTIYHLELVFELLTSDTDGTVTGYRYSTNASNLSSLPWIPLGEMVANLTLTGSAIQQLYIQVIDNYNRTSSPYTLALNLSSPPSGKGSTGPSGQGTDWGFTFLLVVIAVVGALAAILAFVELRKRRRSGGGPTTTTTNSSDSGVAKAIEEHLKQNPNEEEGALVHQVGLMTGASDATVRTQLSILSESHKVEKTESGGATRYTNAAGEVSKEELARMGMITDTMLSTIRSETPVTGRRLKEVLKPYNLSEGEIRNYLLDLRAEIAWDSGADFGDFDSVVFRAMPLALQTPQVEVVVDESALPKFLDDNTPAPPSGKRRRKRSSAI